MAQLENALNQSRVVVFAQGGPPHIGTVDGFAEVALATMLQKGAKTGAIEADAPGTSFGSCIGIIGRLGCLGSEVQPTAGYALNISRIIEDKTKGFGGVKHIIAKAGTQFGQLKLNRIKARFHFPLQTHTGEFSIPDRGFDNALLGGTEARPGISLTDAFNRPINRLTLAKGIGELHQLGLNRFVGFAQFGAIFDAHQVTNNAPAPAQPLTNRFQWLHYACPSRAGCCFEAAKGGLQVF